jgi:hypothetical protein
MGIIPQLTMTTGMHVAHTPRPADIVLQVLSLDVHVLPGTMATLYRLEELVRHVLPRVALLVNIPSRERVRIVCAMRATIFPRVAAVLRLETAITALP